MTIKEDVRARAPRGTKNVRQGSPTNRPLTARERDDIRAARGPHFGHDPSLAQEMFLPPWHSRPQQSHGRRPAAVQSMLARGLVEILPTRAG